MADSVRIVVPRSFAGERVDRMVATLLERPRSQVAALLAGGAVALDGTVVTGRADRVVGGEILEVALPPDPEPTVILGDPSVPFEVVHEDRDLWVVDKPAGVVVHPGAGTRGPTLVHGLVARDPALAAVGPPDRPGVVHRLDVGTSGLMVVARTSEALAALSDAIRQRRVERRYQALTWGVPEPARGVIDAPIGRSRRDRTRRVVAADGRPSRTRYEVTQTWNVPASAAKLDCELETGRTHQIRVHLQSIGTPVVGDVTYGGRRRPDVEPRRPFLHATRIAFVHPRTGRAMEFDSPLPADLAEVESRLGRRPPG